jgi:hypothetical protein
MIIGFRHQIIALANDDSTDILNWSTTLAKGIRQGDPPPPTAETMSFPFGPGLDEKSPLKYYQTTKKISNWWIVDTGFQITNKLTGGYEDRKIWSSLRTSSGMSKTSKVLKIWPSLTRCKGEFSGIHIDGNVDAPIDRARRGYRHQLSFGNN